MGSCYITSVIVNNYREVVASLRDAVHRAVGFNDDRRILVCLHVRGSHRVEEWLYR